LEASQRCNPTWPNLPYKLRGIENDFRKGVQIN
jgi:hypothetical protein